MAAIAGLWSQSRSEEPAWYTQGSQKLMQMEEGRVNVAPVSCSRKPSCGKRSVSPLPTGGSNVVEALLDKDIDDVLQRFPRFRKNFYRCEPTRQRELRVWWKRRESSLKPLLLECHALKNFSENE